MYMHIIFKNNSNYIDKWFSKLLVGIFAKAMYNQNLSIAGKFMQIFRSLISC